MRRTYLSDDSEEEETKIEQMKMLVLGDKGVGKTSFIQRLTRNFFTLYYSPTKNIEIHRKVKIGNMCIECWDVPAHIKYHFKLKSLHADAVVLLFDSTKPHTKDSAMKRWENIHRELPILPYVFVVGVRIPNEKETGVFYIDNMSTEGFNPLLFHIESTVAHAIYQ
jgi:GTPase SAR1 family protein